LNTGVPDDTKSRSFADDAAAVLRPSLPDVFVNVAWLALFVQIILGCLVLALQRRASG